VKIRWQENRALSAAQRSFDSTYQRTDKSVIGRVRGYEVKFQLLFGASWSVQVVMNSIPLAMYLRARTAGREVSPFVSQDPNFHRCYTVDAEPTQIARATLTDVLRDRIITLRPTQLEVTPGQVKLTKDYACYYAEVADICEAIRLAVAVAEQARLSAQSAERKTLQQAITGGQNPYRDDPDAFAANAKTAGDRDLVQTVMQRNKYHWLRQQSRDPEFLVLSILGLIYIFSAVLRILS